MLRNQVRILGIILVAVIAITSCRKEDTISDSKLMQKSSVMSLEDFPQELIDLVENHIAFALANYEDTNFVILDFSKHYAIILTNEDATFTTWVAAEEVQEKTVFTLQDGDIYIGISWKKVCKHHHFVLMTDDERAYLIASGQSMSVSDFNIASGDLVDIITKGFGQTFVATISNNDVYFIGISESGIQASWHERLSVYISELIDDYDPNDGVAYCVYTDDMNEITAWIAMQLYNKRDFSAVYISVTGKWFLCNGDCLKEDCKG